MKDMVLTADQAARAARIYIDNEQLVKGASLGKYFNEWHFVSL